MLWLNLDVSLSLPTEVTLSALNAPEGDVDIEGLGESGANKKLDFDSGVYCF